MSLFSLKKSHRTVVVVDVRSSSIAAGYVVLNENVVPLIVHSVRFPIDPHATEPLAEALPRTLDAVLNALITEGGPLLIQAVGNGKVDTIFTTVTAPWQTSQVQSRVIEEEKPFIFTKQMLASTKKTDVAENVTRVSETVIATLLNGYEVANPFGKKVNRAECFVLSSGIDTDLMEEVHAKLRKAFHQNHVEFDGFMPELYAVTRDLYPHQRDYIVLDVGNEATDVLLVKHGLLVSIASMPHGIGEIARAARGVGLSSPALPMTGSVSMIDASRNTRFASSVEDAEMTWLNAMKASLGAIAKEEPLPRTVMLLAEDSVRDFLRRLLDAPDLRSLWLSDQSLGILPILPAQFAPYIQQTGGADGDAVISLLALAAAKRFKFE